MLAAGFSDNFAQSITGIRDFLYTGGWFMAPLGICWFISMTVILWKCLDLRRRAILPEALVSDLENIESIAAAGRFQTFQNSLRSDVSVLGRICRTVLNGKHPNKESALRTTEAMAREQVSHMERGISVLEITFTIAPMLGLIGTVSGLVRIFSAFGETANSAAQARSISLGIAEAMNTTIAGLVVAVPALIAQVLFSRHVERCALRMSVLVNGLIEAAYRNDPNQEARPAAFGTQPPLPPPGREHESASALQSAAE